MSKKTTILTVLSTIALSSPALSHTIHDPAQPIEAAFTLQSGLKQDALRGEEYVLKTLLREAKAQDSDDGGRSNDRGRGKGDDGHDKGHDHDKNHDHDEDHHGYSFLGSSLIS